MPKHPVGTWVSSKKKKLALLLAGCVVLLGVIVGVPMVSPKPQAVVEAPVDRSAKDLRTEETKFASKKAGEQAIAGDADGAAKTLDAAIARTPSSNSNDLSALYQQKATVAANSGQKEVAIIAINEAIKIQPDNWRLYESLGVIYSYLNDPSNAVKSFQKADDILRTTDEYNTYHARIMGEIAQAKAQGE